MSFELSWTEFSRADYRKLDGAQRVVVDKGLARIRERGMEAGQPLAGELAGCSKIKHRKMGLRIVFRAVGDEIEVIEIVIIGKREGDYVYHQAARRI